MDFIPFTASAAGRRFNRRGNSLGYRGQAATLRASNEPNSVWRKAEQRFRLIAPTCKISRLAALN